MQNKKLITIIGSLCLISSVITFVVILFLNANTDIESDIQLYKKTVKEKYHNFAPPIPETMTFCGEKVPLEYAAIRESLDRELTIIMYQHSQTFLILKKTTRFFPQIEPILKQNNVPSDLKYLCVAESALSNVASPAKAEGFWQFIANTAKKYGLETGEEYDERYDLAKATAAAAKYLSTLNKQFQSWTLACAAFNCGENGLTKRLSEQDINNYWHLSLNNETARYVFRILAYKLVIENPQQYGFYIRLKDCYYPVKTTQIQIDSSVSNFNPICKQLDITYKDFRHFNPQLRQNKLTNKDKKPYVFYIPDKRDLRWINLLPHTATGNAFLK
ncbi:MAG: lytic transglycosylase domain-containing protein [Bacteroidales bacterium]|nr:lytic transglycosylase domain-containing protein [Bacteroidales bacterium]